MEMNKSEKYMIRTLLLLRAHENQRLRTIKYHLYEVLSFHRLPMLENIKHHFHRSKNHSQIQKVTMFNEKVKRKFSKMTNSGKKALPVIDCGNLPLENVKVTISERSVLPTSRNDPREID